LRLHVLVIDDDDAVRSSVVRVLVAHGHDAAGAMDGNQALSLALVRAPHVIILDVHMPLQNGVQVARMLKGHSSLATIPIVALSATPEGVTDTTLFREVLAKPCSSADLLIAVHSAAHPHRRS
jgi:CheY-like chemotaxis protein